MLKMKLLGRLRVTLHHQSIVWTSSYIWWNWTIREGNVHSHHTTCRLW